MLGLPINVIALRYVCSFKGISPLVGVTSPSMLHENIGIYDMGGFTSTELDLIRNLCRDFIKKLNFYSDDSS